jgi:CubicO group peptidase (beta-lactamase class C family)
VINRPTVFKLLCCLSVILIAATGCTSTPPPTLTPTTAAQPTVTSIPASRVDWPTQGWQTSTPEEQGVDAKQLDKMMAAIDAQAINLHSILVIRHGAIVAERYFGSYDQDRRGELYSCTKSFTSTLIGIALDKGLLKDINQPVLGYLDDRTFENVDERKQAMTIENLLTMTPGLEWDEGDPTYTAMYRSADWVKYVLDKPMAFQPGSQFEYNSGASHVLSAIVQKSTGMNTADFARANLFGPLGITKARWDTDTNGLSIGGWGLQLTPREMAKLGYLFLHKGEWDGQQIVSAKWVETATQKHVSTGGDLGNGYQWWIDTEAGAFMALGRYGQTIYVNPDLDLIVVTTAEEDNHDRILGLIH